jgi:cytochrome c oxidase subunit IV
LQGALAVAAIISLAIVAVLAVITLKSVLTFNWLKQLQNLQLRLITIFSLMTIVAVTFAIANNRQEAHFPKDLPLPILLIFVTIMVAIGTFLVEEIASFFGFGSTSFLRRRRERDQTVELGDVPLIPAE